MQRNHEPEALEVLSETSLFLCGVAGVSENCPYRISLAREERYSSVDLPLSKMLQCCHGANTRPWINLR